MEIDIEGNLQYNRYVSLFFVITMQRYCFIFKIQKIKKKKLASSEDFGRERFLFQ